MYAAELTNQSPQLFEVSVCGFAVAALVPWGLGAMGWSLPGMVVDVSSGVQGRVTCFQYSVLPVDPTKLDKPQMRDPKP